MARAPHDLADQRARTGITVGLTAGQRRALALVMVLGIVLRLGWGLWAASPPKSGDPLSYFTLGAELAAGKGYRSETGAFEALSRQRAGRAGVDVPPTAYFPIGYPAVLASLFWTLDHAGVGKSAQTRALAGVLLNVALGSLMLLLVFALARRFVEPTAAIVATGIVALEPNLVFHTGTLRIETIATTLTLLSIFVLVRSPWRPSGPSTRVLVAGGLLAGVTSLVRPLGLAILVLLPLALLLARVGWRAALVAGGTLLACVAVVLAPWTIRNLVELHAPITVSTGMADALCLGRQAGVDGRFAAHTECDRGFAHVPPARYEVARYDKNNQRAFEWVVHHPLSEVGGWFLRMMWANREDHDALAHLQSRLGPVSYASFAFLADAAYLAVLALALVGARRFTRRSDARATFFLLVTVWLFLVPMFLFGDPRFKVPAVPFLAIVAATPLLAAWRGDARRGVEPSPPRPGAERTIG